MKKIVLFIIGYALISPCNVLASAKNNDKKPGLTAQSTSQSTVSTLALTCVARPQLLYKKKAPVPIKTTTTSVSYATATFWSTDGIVEKCDLKTDVVKKFYDENEKTPEFFTSFFEYESGKKYKRFIPHKSPAQKYAQEYLTPVGYQSQMCGNHKFFHSTL